MVRQILFSEVIVILTFTMFARMPKRKKIDFLQFKNVFLFVRTLITFLFCFELPFSFPLPAKKNGVLLCAKIGKWQKI
jgi:hypothetical protein